MKYAGAADEGDVLPNLLGLTSRAAVEVAETVGFLQAEQHLLETLRTTQIFDTRYLRHIHRLALGRVYGFAGRYRTVNLSKGGFPFPGALYLPQGMAAFERDILRKLPHQWPDATALLADIARVHAELLYLHPFREGNGRTARVLANLMAYKGGAVAFSWAELMDTTHFKAYVQAVQRAAGQEYGPMQTVLTGLFRVQ